MSTSLKLALAGAALLAALLGGQVLVSGGPGPAPGPAWPGPLHLWPGAPILRTPIADPRDSAIAWADLVDVEGSFNRWRLHVAERPPQPADLSGASTILSYGLVFDRTGDGVADVIVGISNEAPRAGDFRVWVTDLATGETSEQFGPPYGYPVEFVHPNESSQDHNSRSMLFTFLGGSGPGVTRESPFYAWTSVTRAGEVIAWDYGPDAAWLLFDAGD